MPINIKEHVPIAARSPYFINCVPSSGSITSATLAVTIQRGSRDAAITSMTDIKSYTLTKTDAIDGIIVFDIAPLVRDYIEHTYIEFTGAGVEVSPDNSIYFVKVYKTVVDGGGTTNTTDYYVAKDGYSTFKDGANFEPTTGATGNYPFPTAVAYDTDVTIMATDCYRQIGQDSYGLIGIYVGQFEHNHPETDSLVKIKFGSGEDWKTSFAATTNVVSYTIADPNDLATRLDNVEQALLYYPIGKKTLGGSWVSGEDYLRVGHFVKASEIGGTETLGEEVTDSYQSAGGNVVDNGNSTFTWDVTNKPFAGQVSVTIEAEAITGFPTPLNASFDIDSFTSSTITVSTQDQSDEDHLTAVISDGQLSLSITYLKEVVNGLDDIASINDQPTIRYEILCEPKYNVIDCYFINKWGAWDTFSFLKKSVESFSTTSNQYKPSIGSVTSNAYGYSTTDHQMKQYNKNGQKSITVNTGFVNESFNLLLEEMMLSEKMYLIIDDVAEPVNIKTTSTEYKTGVNDKTINYTIEFEFAYNQLNNVI
jgi:hypothetical protein